MELEAERLALVDDTDVGQARAPAHEVGRDEKIRHAHAILGIVERRRLSRRIE